MKRNPVSLIAGGVLLLAFLAILFFFQVRQTEVAIVTTFGRAYASSTKTEPGPYFRFPWPINKVYRFDKRVRNFERKFEQTVTSDARNLLITVYIGWSIADPLKFLQRFDGDVIKAEQNLENLLRDAKNGVIGQHKFSDLISTEEDQLQFETIETKIREAVQAKARDNYGIDISLVGIKRLGLPESITGKVFERMREERLRLVKGHQGKGEAEAIEIRAKAELKRREILAEAEAEATIMTGQAEAIATQHYRVLNQAPEFARFLLGIKTLREATSGKTTLILDPDTPPFDLLKEQILKTPNSSGSPPSSSAPVGDDRP